MAVTGTPTIPSDWTPSSSGCLQTSDYWIWDYHNTQDERSVLGGPSQTTACLPPGFESTGLYLGSQCPSHYTTACQPTSSTLTCCPTFVSSSISVTH
jgi:hypothetical protein